MKHKIFIMLLVSILFASCNSQKNPLLSDFDAPFGIPPFEKIQNSHYKPAFEKTISIHREEIEKIINNSAPATFENTIQALEYSGTDLQKVASVFYNLLSANTNDELQAIARDISPLLSKHQDEITMNEKLFARIEQVYNSKEQLDLEIEDKKLLDETYKKFVRSGANLNEGDKAKMMKINEELSLLSLQFGENILAEINQYKLIIDNKEDLAGLPEQVISAAAETSGEEGKWVFTLHKPSWIPFLQYAENRELREKLYKAMYNSGNNNNEYDNKEIIKKTLQLRKQRANLLGFENHATYALDERMAKKPENVYDLLNKLWVPALENAKIESNEMREMIKRDGHNFDLESWDWWYYAEKIRKEKYDLDESELRPYFELNNVRDGAFLLAEKLWGLSFVELKNVPLPHPDAAAYEVKDKDNSHIGVFFFDFFPRASKRGGAWMNSFREQYRTSSGEKVSPIVINVCNFSKPTGDLPALLSFDEVETLFHEFGHALHGLLSNCKYESLSGTSVPRDFVELPSQIMENWCSEPEMLKLFAKHYETGEVIPQTLIDKIINSSKFNQGFVTVEYLAASFLDMDYHTYNNTEDINIEEFETESMNKIGLINEIIPRYKSTYFNHIWNSGYAAGYYSYIWAEVLDADAFDAFLESGDIFNKDTALRFRDEILSKGGTRDAMDMYLSFRGKEPSITPLLSKRGLLK
jgi:peptidyl-dipeptidase Dcp